MLIHDIKVVEPSDIQLVDAIGKKKQETQSPTAQEQEEWVMPAQRLDFSTPVSTTPLAKSNSSNRNYRTPTENYSNDAYRQPRFGSAGRVLRGRKAGNRLTDKDSKVRDNIMISQGFVYNIELTVGKKYSY